MVFFHSALIRISCFDHSTHLSNLQNGWKEKKSQERQLFPLFQRRKFEI